MSAGRSVRLQLFVCFLLSVALALVGVAGAHATLVIGTLQGSPDPAPPGANIDITIDLMDPAQVEVEDAVIFLELRTAETSSTALSENEQPRSQALLITDRLSETSPGSYHVSIERPADGAYTLSVRDRTYRQEEAVANLAVSFGDEPLGEVAFVLPPTDIGPASLGTWLIWLIAVPLLAGVVVTVLVLRGGKAEGDGPEGAAEA